MCAPAFRVTRADSLSVVLSFYIPTMHSPGAARVDSAAVQIKRVEAAMLRV